MTASPEISHLTGVGMALALGLLVGLQRGWASRNREDGSRFAGIRTFALFGLGGGIAGVLYDQARGPAMALLVAACALVILGYARTTRTEGPVSGTSGVVALLTLASGFLAGSGERLLGTAVAAVMVLLLSMREQLHGWVQRIEQREMLSIARFAVIALVILPLLPDAPFGPYLAWNPRKLWLVVVMVSGFSFAGYVAARLLGPTRGVIATAAAGSVVSSTAVTASLAARLRANTLEGLAGTALAAAGVSTASVVMFLRVLVLAGVLAPFALPSLARLVAPGILVSLAASAWYLAQGRKATTRRDSDAMEMRNPFDLGPALGLTALVMVLSVAAHWVLEHYGDRGLALVLAISGMVDVDSAIITMGGLPAGTLPPVTAGLVLAVPVTLNTLVKAGIAIAMGGWEKGRHSAWPLLASALAVVLAWVVTGAATT